MFFKESKRLKKKADKAKLRDFKRDIFDEAIPVATTSRKVLQIHRENGDGEQHSLQEHDLQVSQQVDESRG